MLYRHRKKEITVTWDGELNAKYIRCKREREERRAGRRKRRGRTEREREKKGKEKEREREEKGRTRKKREAERKEKKRRRRKRRLGLASLLFPYFSISPSLSFFRSSFLLAVRSSLESF